jgi:alpha-galactosidase
MAGALVAAGPYRDARFAGADAPGVRLVSGLVTCDEALRDGRLLGRYWTSTGVIKRDALAENEMRSVQGLPIDSFELALEGQDLSGGWKWTAAGSEQTAQGLLATVELSSAWKPVSLKVRTLLTGGPVMVRWLEITNRGKAATAITKVSPWSGMLWNTPFFQERLERGSDSPFEIAYTSTEDQLYEGAWRLEPLGDGSRTISGTRGKSGWGHPTFFAHNRGTGEWFVASLGWSGNWSMHLTGALGNRDRARFFFSLGPAAADPALRVIAPGETVTTPETHLLAMRGDLDSVVQALHEHVRRNVVLPPSAGREHQVEANHRGYIADREDEPGLKREIDIAADVGAEMFVVDAGWYGPAPNIWYLNTGEWHAGPWLPNDLTPVREYARKKGLLFGLWVEIESVGPAAKIRKEHPEWLMRRNGRPVAEGRQLDFSNPDAAA